MTARRDASADLRRRFAENLIVLRHRVGLSQAGTAERAGLHRTQIGLLERKLRLPRLDTIVKLGGAVEAEPCELLSGMEWRLGGGVRRAGAYAHENANSVEEASTRMLGDGPASR